MKFAIQINSYKGDGTPLETEYRFGYIETNGKEGTLRLIDWDKPIGFTINSLTIDDTGMSLKAVNKDGYGRIDICFSDSSSVICRLAEEQVEIDRLMNIYNDTPNYYEKNYGDIKNVKETARKNLEGKRNECK